MNIPENYTEYRKLMSDLQITKALYMKYSEQKKKAFKEYTEATKKTKELKEKLISLIPNPLN